MEGKYLNKINTTYFMASNIYQNFISIDTTSEIDHLWNWLDTLSNRELVKRLLSERIGNSFYVDKANVLKLKSLEGNKEIKLELLQKKNINGTLVSEIINSAKQAKELFQKAKESSILLQPLLYFYGTEALERCLVLMTFKKGDFSKTHGLSKGSSRSSCHIRQNGFFQIVHCCISSDLSLFQKDWKKFNLKDLFYLNPELLSVYEYIYDEPHQQIDAFKKSKKKDLRIDLENMEHLPIKKDNMNLEYLDVLHITCFILSTYMRYSPGRWIDFLENTQEGHLAKIFLTIYPRRLPNLILNYIYGKKFVIAPTARFGGSIESKFMKKR